MKVNEVRTDKTLLSSQEHSNYIYLNVAMFCGFIISDIIRKDVNIHTIKTCDRLINLYDLTFGYKGEIRSTPGKNKLPDFIHMLANWSTSTKDSEQEFIYQTLIPLVEDFIDDPYFFGMLKTEYDDNPIPSTEK